jgi:hypothetical protein
MRWRSSDEMLGVEIPRCRDAEIRDAEIRDGTHDVMGNAMPHM